MPNMANITVKKSDGTTDIVYSQMVASAGDKAPALWRANSVGTAAAFRPELSCVSQWNGPRTARRVYLRYSYPSTTIDATGGVVLQNRAIFETTAVVPTGMTDADLAEAVSQYFNLGASTLIKDSFKVGFAPT